MCTGESLNAGVYDLIVKTGANIGENSAVLNI